jgi:oxygen-independent coproporphyrinogen-3 oxidase
LRAQGVERVSLGVQSFDAGDAGAMGRPQRADDVERALSLLRAADFPTLNIDLIYGADGQTLASFLESIQAALVYRPEEIYLYPLYVRPLTGLGRRARQWDDFRLAAYRAGRDLLLERDYEQISMRMFRAPHAGEMAGPVYCCQDDGMIGLGCGARSYTRSLHYAQRYAVEPRAIAAIVNAFVAQDEVSLAVADYGFELNANEQRRRFAIQSLLQAAGVDREHYNRRFGVDVLDDFAELPRLEFMGLAEIEPRWIRLTPAGLELSDAIGPWLYSPAVRGRMEAFAWR